MLGKEAPIRRLAASHTARALRCGILIAGLGAGLGAGVGAGAGCAVPIRIADLNKEIPRTTMPIAVRAGIDTMSDPETARRVQRLLADPQMRAVQEALVAGLVDGTLATLSDKERAERIGAMTMKAMTGLLQGASRELSAGLGAATQSALDGALDTALSPVHRRQLETLLTEIVVATIRAVAAGLREAEVGKHLSESITDQVGPALGKALREEVAPGFAALLQNEELNRALGATAKRLGRELVLGATEALAQTQQPKADGSLLSRITELAQQGARLFGSAAWLLILIIAALLAWTLKLLAQSRSYREEAERRAAMTRFLTEATKVAQGKPWSEELLSALQDHLRAEEQAIAELRAKKRGAKR